MTDDKEKKNLTEEELKKAEVWEYEFRQSNEYRQFVLARTQ